MTAFLLRRVLALIPTFLFASIIVFSAVRLIPGDVIDELAAEIVKENTLTKEEEKNL